MARKHQPRPVHPSSDDAPECVLTITRGSNNHTRATLRLFEYPNSDMCLQLEDKLGGAELWGSANDIRAIGQQLIEKASIRK